MLKKGSTICPLILVVLSLIWGQALSKRPYYVPKSVMLNGCIPGSNVCPAQMYCHIDPNYAYQGTCSCAGLHSKELTPPKFTGNELAMPKSRDDCRKIHRTLWLAVAFWTMYAILYARLFTGLLMMAHRVYKNGGAKFNSSYLSLFGCAALCFGELCRSSSYIIVRANWDSNWGFFDWFFHMSNLIPLVFGYWYRYEIICTWFDLFQKSVNLSKRSSIAAQIIRLAIKVMGLFSLTLGILMAAKIFDFRDLVNIAGFFHLVVLSSSCVLAAPLIIRVLCKDMRNVTHPNWKAAAAIRRVAFNEPFCQLGIALAQFFYTKNTFYAAQGAIVGNAILVAGWFYLISSTGEWFGYLMFAHRRYLNEADTSRISQFFGFTTLGLNGSITSEIISRASSIKSSVASTIMDSDDKEEE
jgi:hypothetical protein